MSLVSELQKVGLSDKEAKVYLATLELASASVGDISKKSGVNRATTYVILDSLIEKGLCSTFSKDKKTFYVATDPKLLDSIFESQKREVEEKQKQFKSVLSQLNLINNRQKDKPSIKFFEGKRGILKSSEEFYDKYHKSDEPVRFIYPLDRLTEITSDEDEQKFKDIRLKRKVKSKVLYTSSKELLKSTLDGQRMKISNKYFPLTSDIAIYGDNVRLTSLGDKLSSVLIKDKEIANTLKSIFDLAWEGAKNESKNNKNK